ncbi:MAG: hypothetical protein AAF730_13105, partial [Bacteroidota bacterium]
MKMPPNRALLCLALCLACCLASQDVFGQQWNGSTNASSSIYRAGKVGIGNITTPLAPLHTSGVYSLSGAFESGSLAIFDGGSPSNPGNYARHITLSFAGKTTARLGVLNTLDATGGYERSRFYINADPNEASAWNSPDLVITHEGRVGIGTSSPSSSYGLHVNNGPIYQSAAGESNFHRIKLRRSGTGGSIASPDLYGNGALS